MDIGQIGNISKPIARDSQPVAIAAPVVTAKSVNAQTADAVQQPDAAQSQKQVGQALQGINKVLKELPSSLEFEIDEDSNRAIVKVMDQQTKEVIRQMPTAEALEIYKALDKLQGMLLKQKA